MKVAREIEWIKRPSARKGLIVAVVLLVGFAIHLGRDRSGRGDDLGPVFTVKDGPLTISVTESGTIKPREQEIIKCELEGQTTILYLIPEGTQVKKGELLVELDASNLEDSKVDQEIRVQNAEAAFIQSRENLAVVQNQAKSDVDKAELTMRFALEDLDQYKQGEYPNTLKEREAKITLAREDHRRAEEQLKWSSVLFEEKYLAESELQADELSVKKARLDVELAENNLALLTQFTFKRTVAQLESDVKQSEMALERTHRKASANTVQAGADLRAKESEFNRQQDKLTKLEEQISKARIVAPRDGLVIYATSARFSWRGGDEPLGEGQEVRERQELIHLPTASTFMAEISIHESNLDKVRVGFPVQIKVGALPGRVFTGEVATIAPLPDATSVFMNPDLKLYTTEIHLEGGGGELRTGMSCQAEIMIEHFASAVYVPVQSIVRVGRTPTAYVVKGANIDARAVEIGLDNNRMVRVVEGLTPGETVLLAPPLRAPADPNGVSTDAPAGPPHPRKP